jgi:hypothetical protein
VFSAGLVEPPKAPALEGDSPETESAEPQKPLAVRQERIVTHG